MASGRERVVGLVVFLLAQEGLAQHTHAPTPTNFKGVPTSVPTSIPTSSPTYGPSSLTVVEYIMGGVLGGILALVVGYFILGYWMYVSEMEIFERTMDDKEKREEVARRRNAIPHGQMYENDALTRATKQVDIDLEPDSDDETEKDTAPLLEPPHGAGTWSEVGGEVP